MKPKTRRPRAILGFGSTSTVSSPLPREPTLVAEVPSSVLMAIKIHMDQRVYVWHMHTSGPNPEGVYHAAAASGRTVCGLVTDDEDFAGAGTKGWATRAAAE